ncbi:SPOR domain-containing protein [Bosea caraganae]|uniref:SPOR domain-containing protein n=1 Tax=Bosea caraganae TaxID=2763117 RepID=A0A370LCL5_9HYPH|nr:SPOR domain-containing protein [Bosea caraganae]RDJ27624.1 SPOR domain-containing protein [Bosea caraganae]RDJ29638.1 SPOR domain-containing protein [Bosea caraganae]
MSEPARNRFALDLDDLERQLRGAAQAPKPGNSVDPLVELTRIVGQDDPLKELFATRPAQPAAAQSPSWPQARQEPSFAPAVVQRAAAEVSAPPADVRGALDEFEALLRRTEPTRPAPAAEPEPAPQQSAATLVYDYAAPEPYRYRPPEPVQPAVSAPRDLDQERPVDQQDYGQQDYGYQPQAYPEPPQAEDELRDLERPRSRKGLWAAAALIAVAVAGTAGAMVWKRSGPVTSDGLPPVISADGGPTKVQPANPGGTEIPNQNKQIYERAGESAPIGQTRVVSREEQPVDVQQAARSLAPRVVMPGPGTGANTNPLAQAPAAVPASAVVPAGTTPAELTAVPAVPGLGEPRRVRTVSIRPDGAPAPAANTSTAYANGTVPGVNGMALPLVTGSAPSRAAANPVAAPTAPAPGTLASATMPRPRPAAPPEPPKAQERVATPAPATTPAAPVRVASAAPAAQSTPAPATAAIRAGTGDFVVQLAAPGSEAEARATFSALQRKYPEQLGGKAPIVRKTDLAGGKTVYRLRIGPYSRDDATTMCTALQGAGGQCFIAKN